MASKALLFLLAFLMLAATKVSSSEKIEIKYVKVAEPAALVPVKAPTPPYKPPTPAAAPPPLPPVKTRADCIPLCGERCRLHSRMNLCLRACMSCCERCKCVPPGTSGNRDMCGKCCTDMKTHNDKPKCP